MSALFPVETKGFKVHIFDGTINNIYLMEYEDKAFLVDPGVAGDMPKVVSYLNENLIDISKIRFSFVSHMHPDHSGCAVSLRKVFGLPIAAHEWAARWYGGIWGGFQYLLDCYMTIQVAKRRGVGIGDVRFDRYINPEFPLKGNSLLPEFPDWEVLHLPGHTAHDLVLFNKAEKLLYVADQIIEFKDAFHLPLPVLFKDAMLDSYKRLSMLDADTLLFAHGGPVFFCGDNGLYDYMISLLDGPLSILAKQVHFLSCYSPEIARFKNGLYSKDLRISDK